MGNQCCAGDHEQDHNTDFKANQNGQVRENPKSTAARLDQQHTKDGVKLVAKDHLPEDFSKDYTVFNVAFPPTLTAEASKAEAQVHQLTPLINNDPLNYPTSTYAYVINSTKEIYKGQFYNRLPHGFGEMYEPTNLQNPANQGLETVTKGNTVALSGNESKSQFGSATYANNPAVLSSQQYIKYTGCFKLGKKSGFGRAIYPDGSIYMGDWLDNLPHGKGRLQSYTDSASKEFYDGEWKLGQMEGRGKQQWRDGTIYEGGFINGKKDGKGVFSWPDGNKYDGEYKLDLRHGYGVFTW